MRWALVFLFFLSFAGTTRSAQAAEAPATVAKESAREEAPVRREPMKPENAIPVVGIVCYAIIPAIIILTVTILASAWVRGQIGLPAIEALSNPALQMQRGLPAPPRGVILFRF